MINYGASITGASNPARPRAPEDFYPTPGGTTRSFLSVLRECGFPNELWEPFCGEGHMSKVLKADGYEVYSSDLVDRGYGARCDFLKTTKAVKSAIVSNPPFKYATEMIVHALVVLGVDYLAFVLPNNFWSADGRFEFFRAYEPSIINPFTWRIDSTGGGAPTMNVQLTVWSAAVPPPCRFRPLKAVEKHAGRLL